MFCRAMETLQELNLSETRKNRFTEAALEKLMDFNLTSKYALTGQLGKWKVATHFQNNSWFYLSSIVCALAFL